MEGILDSWVDGKRKKKKKGGEKGKREKKKGGEKRKKEKKKVATP